MGVIFLVIAQGIADFFLLTPLTSTDHIFISGLAVAFVASYLAALFGIKTDTKEQTIMIAAHVLLCRFYAELFWVAGFLTYKLQLPTLDAALEYIAQEPRLFHLLGPTGGVYAPLFVLITIWAINLGGRSNGSPPISTLFSIIEEVIIFLKEAARNNNRTSKPRGDE